MKRSTLVGNTAGIPGISNLLPTGHAWVRAEMIGSGQLSEHNEGHDVGKKKSLFHKRSNSYYKRFAAFPFKPQIIET